MTNLEGKSTLTPIQQQRYDFLFPTYGPQAEPIVKNLYGKGKSSWGTFLEKMEQVREAKSNKKEYFEALYEAFPLGETFSSGEIIGGVNEVRRDLGLSLYTEKIKIQSEYDFNLVFVIQDVYELREDGIKKTIIGYMPVAKVLPE